MFFLCKFTFLFFLLNLHVFSTEILGEDEISSASVTPGSSYATLDRPFERVISLGHACLTKVQINTYFCPDRHHFQTKPGHSDLFDWMFIYDYDLLADALENGLKDFFEKEDFIKTDFIERKAVFNQKYNMQWNHLFDKRMNAYSEVHTTNCEDYVSLEFFNDAYEKTREKIDYLKSKFIEAKDKKTLYVIYHPNCGPALETLLRIRNALIDIRNGDMHFVLLFVPHSKTYEGIENIVVREALNSGAGSEAGNPIRWKEILDEFNFASNIWE